MHSTRERRKQPRKGESTPQGDRQAAQSPALGPAPTPPVVCAEGVCLCVHAGQVREAGKELVQLMVQKLNGVHSSPTTN